MPDLPPKVEDDTELVVERDVFLWQLLGWFDTFPSGTVKSRNGKVRVEVHWFDDNVDRTRPWRCYGEGQTTLVALGHLYDRVHAGKVLPAEPTDDSVSHLQQRWLEAEVRKDEEEDELQRSAEGSERGPAVEGPDPGQEGDRPGDEAP